MENKICCMFEEKNADLAVYHRDLEKIAVFRDSYRSSDVLYRCRRCGGLVYYSYEEIANLYGGWDNADVFENYIPVVGEVTDLENWEEVQKARTFRHYITGHNMEDDPPSSYKYWFEDN